jgi:hypothetical protein
MTRREFGLSVSTLLLGAQSAGSLKAASPVDQNTAIFAHQRGALRTGWCVRRPQRLCASHAIARSTGHPARWMTSKSA